MLTIYVIFCISCSLILIIYFFAFRNLGRSLHIFRLHSFYCAPLPHILTSTGAIEFKSLIVVCLVFSCIKFGYSTHICDTSSISEINLQLPPCLFEWLFPVYFSLAFLTFILDYPLGLNKVFSSKTLYVVLSVPYRPLYVLVMPVGLCQNNSAEDAMKSERSLLCSLFLFFNLI